MNQRIDDERLQRYISNYMDMHPPGWREQQREYQLLCDLRDERAATARLRQRMERLEAALREHDVDPDNLPDEYLVPMQPPTGPATERQLAFLRNLRDQHGLLDSDIEWRSARMFGQPVASLNRSQICDLIVAAQRSVHEAEAVIHASKQRKCDVPT